MRQILPALLVLLVLSPLARADLPVPCTVPDPSGGSRVFHSTRIRFVPENNDAWYARWHMLSNARRSIDITYFNFYKDLFGRALLGMLHRKAEEGVHIRLMVDSRGSLSLATRFFAQRYLREMAGFPNVEIRIYRPLWRELLKLPRSIRSVIASNHDKIMVVDGEWAVIGGRNLGEHYFTSPEDDEGSYRDNDLLLRGEGVAGQIEQAFEYEFCKLDNLDLGLWMLAGEPSRLIRELQLARDVMDRWIRGDGLLDPAEVAPDERRLLAELSREMSAQSRLVAFQEFQRNMWREDPVLPVEVLDKSSHGDPLNDITDRMLALFDEAEASILIQNAYLVLTERALAALQRASDRGVEVTILTNSPASTHNVLVQAYFVRDWKFLLRDMPNLRIFMATDDHKIHAKTFVIDERVVSVGSYNLDPMSEAINSELMALIEDEGFAREVRARLEKDVAAAVECEIRIDEDGVPVGVVGPDDYLSGISGWIIRLISHLPFLRPLV